MKVGIIGLGFVGGAIHKSFTEKKIKTIGYDKFKNEGVKKFDDLLECQILFLCLPTPFSHKLQNYDLSPIDETCKLLEEKKYLGIVVIKSTVCPGTCQKIAKQYASLTIIHNPEFLSANTAYEDFHHQFHIVIGGTSSCKKESLQLISNFYHENYPDAEISLCQSEESELMKMAANDFYAIKVQFFNEIYLLCEKMDYNYQKVRDLMLKNRWINPMHTKVGEENTNPKLLINKDQNEKKEIIKKNLSYGGFCFPKDTNALLSFMKQNNTQHQLLEAVVKEREEMRPHDHPNVIE